MKKLFNNLKFILNNYFKIKIYKQKKYEKNKTKLLKDKNYQIF